MAMIKCPECQKEINDTNTSCPNCGCPLLNETERTTCQEPKYAEEREIITEKTEIKKHSIFRSKKFIIPMIVICIFILSGSIFTGVKFHNMKQEAISVSYDLEQWTNDKLSEKFPTNSASEILKMSDSSLDEAIASLENLKERYNNLNDYQKQYISDTAKNVNIDNAIILVQYYKQTKQGIIKATQGLLQSFGK